VIIEGEPNLQCELTVGSPEDFYECGMVATARHIVNAIPFVHDAPPGLISSLDLPLTTAFRSFV